MIIYQLMVVRICKYQLFLSQWNWQSLPACLTFFSYTLGISLSKFVFIWWNQLFLPSLDFLIQNLKAEWLIWDFLVGVNQLVGSNHFVMQLDWGTWRTCEVNYIFLLFTSGRRVLHLIPKNRCMIDPVNLCCPCYDDILKTDNCVNGQIIGLVSWITSIVDMT